MGLLPRENVKRRHRLRILIRGIPHKLQPDYSHKKLSLFLIAERTNDGDVIVAMGYFNGKDTKSVTAKYTPLGQPPGEVKAFISEVLDMLDYGGYELVVYDWQSVYNNATIANLKRLGDYIKANKVRDVKEVMTHTCVDGYPLEDLLVELGMNKANLLDTSTLSKKMPKKVENAIRQQIEEYAKYLYIAYFALTYLATKCPK
ncbi:MAG: hypothetical protein ACK4SY_09710 [Pyrobaculum sp.]